MGGRARAVDAAVRVLAAALARRHRRARDRRPRHGRRAAPPAMCCSRTATHLLDGVRHVGGEPRMLHLYAEPDRRRDRGARTLARIARRDARGSLARRGDRGGLFGPRRPRGASRGSATCSSPPARASPTTTTDSPTRAPSGWSASTARSRPRSASCRSLRLGAFALTTALSRRRCVRRRRSRPTTASRAALAAAGASRDRRARCRRRASSLGGRSRRSPVRARRTGRRARWVRGSSARRPGQRSRADHGDAGAPRAGRRSPGVVVDVSVARLMAASWTAACAGVRQVRRLATRRRHASRTERAAVEAAVVLGAGAESSARSRGMRPSGSEPCRDS